MSVVWSALVFAVGAGVATVLSPCALPLVPGYVGYYVSATDGDHRVGVVVRATAVAAGVLATLGGLAGLAVVAGQSLTGAVPLLEPVVGVALVALGTASVSDRVPDWHVALPARRGDTAGFALFGVGYAGAAAGCVLPVFLAVIVQALTLPPVAGAAVVVTYAASVALPLFGLTVALGIGVDVTTGQLAAYGDRVESAAGVVLLLAGVGQILVAVAPGLLPTTSLV